MTILHNSEKQVDGHATSVASEDGVPPVVIDKAVQRRLIWKMDLIILPALGE
jgi:hypothetical protein